MIKKPTTTHFQSKCMNCFQSNKCISASSMYMDTRAYFLKIKGRRIKPNQAMLAGTAWHEEMERGYKTINEYSVDKFFEDLHKGKEVTLKELFVCSSLYGFRGVIDLIKFHFKNDKLNITIIEFKSIYQSLYVLQLCAYALILTDPNFDIIYKRTKRKTKLVGITLYPNLFKNEQDVTIDIKLITKAKYVLNQRWLYHSKITEWADGIASAIRRRANSLRKWHPFMLAWYKEFPLCVPPETLIISNTAIKKIPKIKMGDLILTHTGHQRKVTNIFERKYNGDLIEIETHGCHKLKLTPEHPILIWNRKIRLRKKLSLKSYSHVKRRKWLSTSKIKVGDYIAMPKLLNRKRRLVYGKKKSGNYINPISKMFFKRTKSVEDVLWVCGLFVAEGHTSPDPNPKRKHIWTYTSFTLGSHETNLINKLVKLLTDFGFNPRITCCGSSTRICVGNIQLATFFHENFYVWGGNTVHYKQIPQWLMNLPDYLQKHFIKGLWDGDGSIKGDFRISSACRRLIEQYRMLLFKAGIFCSFEKHKNNNIILGNKVNSGDIYTLSVYGRHARRLAKKILNIYLEEKKYNKDAVIETSNLFYVRVRKINKIPYSGMVYNIEVNQHESYTANGIAIHNCKSCKQMPSHCSHWNEICSRTIPPSQGKFKQRFFGRGKKILIKTKPYIKL